MSSAISRDEAISRMMECVVIATSNPLFNDETKEQLTGSIRNLIETRRHSDRQLLDLFDCADRDMIVAIRNELDSLELLEAVCRKEPIPGLFTNAKRLVNYWYCRAFQYKENGYVHHSCGEHLCIGCAGYRRAAGMRSMVNKLVGLGEGDMATLTLSVPVSENPAVGWSHLQFAMNGLRDRIHAARLRKRNPSPAVNIMGYSLRWDLAKVEDGFRHHVHGIIKLKTGSNLSEVRAWIEGTWASFNDAMGGLQ